jgi:putative transposase
VNGGIFLHDRRYGLTQLAGNRCMNLDDASGRFRFPIRDRDAKFTATLDTVFTATEIPIIKTPARAPRANASSAPFAANSSTTS